MPVCKDKPAWNKRLGEGVEINNTYLQKQLSREYSDFLTVSGKALFKLICSLLVEGNRPTSMSKRFPELIYVKQSKPGKISVLYELFILRCFFFFFFPFVPTVHYQLHRPKKAQSFPRRDCHLKVLGVIVTQMLIVKHSKTCRTIQLSLNFIIISWAVTDVVVEVHVH